MNDSARVSGQDRKKPPALGTNHIAGIGGFRPLASLEKINIYISFKDIFIRLKHISSTQNRTCLNTRETKSKDKKIYYYYCHYYYYLSKNAIDLENSFFFFFIRNELF